MNKNVPEIRFQGFHDDWEQRKVRELFTVTRGQVLAVSEVSSIKTLVNPYPVYSSQTKNNGLLGYYHDYLFDGGITWTTDGANAGTVKYRNGKFYSTNVNGVLLSNDGYMNKSIAEILNKSAWKYVSHVGNPKLMNNVMSDIKIEIPTKISEQKNLSGLIDKIDNLITLHQRKLNLLQEQKKSLLQKMFPKKDEKIPEIRFNGFTDDWEQRKLGEVADIVGGGTPSTTEEDYWNGDIDWYTPAEIGDSIYVSHSKKTITKLGLSKSSAKLLPVGTILFTSRAGIGNTAILGKISTTNQGFQSIVPDENRLDTYFIFSLSKMLKKYGEKMGAGSTFLEVSGKTMSKMTIYLPDVVEQHQIGTFLKHFDNLITLHQRKLDALQEQKKGLLQKMFV
ncbi:putative type-1 restriction enzyme specificity protein [Fructobacillus sp. EFB-N1]|uniref:restriction endonuclease subunit S n=1 Tax=Fructobacillus sp. EFB-N1 TaxID=1658766 RepID=UPI00064DDCC3|nr:restriction endonuclease subunit S [Fructobacillus sp. EFB-N1]KMK52749.1 putative type-1 restriction enzyme specificity protein [Fructobacillus sp. EFB-N1]